MWAEETKRRSNTPLKIDSLVRDEFQGICDHFNLKVGWKKAFLFFSSLMALQLQVLFVYVRVSNAFIIVPNIHAVFFTSHHSDSAV